ncbi:FHA domain-containing protein [Mycobacterium hubeiense]|uniref:FHA domain-containing protein n=1 Tax=Mycobacterium hubeiense TaxID=1867256 RepID=UPI001303FB6A|nr:FHA domain-containing protein [Mycobacterium sp. QGD 101]
MTDQSVRPAPPIPNLVVRCASTAVLARPTEGPVVIGRERSEATEGVEHWIPVDDRRISRTHVRIDPTSNGWTATDPGSRNGMFLNGERVSVLAITDGMVIHLGNPDGSTVSFGFDSPTSAALSTAISGAGTDQHAPAHDESDDVELDEGEAQDTSGDDATNTGEQTDPDVARAGAVARARRLSRGKSQRDFEKAGIISQTTLVNFERGRHWPRARTRAKLESVLGLPQGGLAAIKRGEPIPDDDPTEVVSVSAEFQAMRRLAEVALNAITARIDLLPAPSEPAFSPSATALLAELRTLLDAAAEAARSSEGVAAAKMLINIRRTYHDLMMRAAGSPGATLGQRLYAARRNADLTEEETAAAAGVPVDAVRAVEAEQPLAGGAAMALENVISTLTHF